MAGLDPAIQYVCGEGWIMPAQANLRSLRKLGCAGMTSTRLACQTADRTELTWARPEILVRPRRGVRRFDHHERVVHRGVAIVAGLGELAKGLGELSRLASLDGEIEHRKSRLDRGLDQIGHRQTLPARHRAPHHAKASLELLEHVAGERPVLGLARETELRMPRLNEHAHEGAELWIERLWLGIGGTLLRLRRLRDRPHRKRAHRDNRGKSAQSRQRYNVFSHGRFLSLIVERVIQASSPGVSLTLKSTVKLSLPCARLRGGRRHLGVTRLLSVTRGRQPSCTPAPIPVRSPAAPRDASTSPAPCP